MNFGAFITGSFKDIADAEIKNVRDAGSAAIKAGTDKGLSVARTQVQSAGMGSRLANAWQSRLFPKNLRADNPAGLVYTKAPLLIAAFDAGGTITAKNAQWLVLPLQAAIDAGWQHEAGGRGVSGGQAPHWSNVAAALARFGNLRFVPLRGGTKALLVADARVINSKRGVRFGKIKNRTSQPATVPFFLLVRRITLRKELDVAAVQQAAADEMFGTYNSELNKN